MEIFQEANIKSKKHLQNADHMLSMTYPLIKDPKILLAVLNNMDVAISSIIDTVLEYDKLYKRISTYEDTFEAKFEIFKKKCVSKYGFNPDFIQTVKEIKETIKAHKESPVEFSKKDKFVICNEKYKFKILEADTLKKQITKTKLYYNIVQNILKNDRIFN